MVQDLPRAGHRRLIMLRYIRSLGYALEGLVAAFRTERNLRLFVALYVLSLIVAGVLHISARDWEIVLATGSVFLSIELLNTALERFTDAFDKHSASIHRPAIKMTKDIAASASLMCAVGWVSALAIVFVPYLWS